MKSFEQVYFFSKYISVIYISDILLHIKKREPNLTLFASKCIYSLLIEKQLLQWMCLWS